MGKSFPWHWHHYSCNLYQIADLISKNHQQIKLSSIDCSHWDVGGGAHILVSEDDEQQQEKLNIQQKELLAAEWASLGNQFPADIKSMITADEKINSKFDTRYEGIV